MALNILHEKKGLNEENSDVILQTIEKMRCAFKYSSLSELYPDVIDSLSTVYTGDNRPENNRDRKERYIFIAARNKRTLKRLREKGYCREKTMNQLRQAAFSQTYLAATYVCIVMEKIFEESVGRSVDLNFPVSEDVWIKAVEQTQIIHKPEMINDQQTNLTTSAVDNIESVYFLACIFCGLNWLSKETKGIFVKLDEAKKNAESKVKQPEEAEIKDRAAEEYSRWKAEEERLNKQIREYEKESSRLNHENGRLKAEIERLSGYIKNLASRETEKNKAEKEECAAVPATENVERCSEQGSRFPERAIFLGGHPNMVKKLKDRHPDWIYISPENDKAAFSNEFSADKIDAIIYWSNHVSHILDRKIRKKCPNIPIVYVTSTNVSILEEEISRRYASLTDKISKSSKRQKNKNIKEQVNRSDADE